MKKIIAWLLLVVMLLGTFAGCGNAEQTPTTAAENGAADAIAYLKAFYKDAGTETFADFDRLGIVRIAGVAYTVVWTADVSEDLVKAVVNEDGSVTIDVNESNETATTYNLTATVTDDAGNTASHSWNYVLPVGLGNDYGAIVDMAYELKNGEAFDFDSTLVGTVTAINTAWSDEYKNITVTIVVEGREDKPIKCYRLKGDGANELAAGDLITVTGKLKNYNGTIEFDSGCTLDKVEKGAGTLGDVPTDPKEIVDAAFALEVGASLPYTATLTGEVTAIDTPYSADYKNISVSIKVAGREDKPILCYRLKGEGADQIMPGDTITVSGVIKNHNGTIEFDAGCSLVELIKGENSFVMPTTTKEILELAYDLEIGEAIPVQVTLTGLIFKVDTPYSDRYGNISVWMVVDGMYDKPVMAFRLKGADADKIWTNDTITVTGTLKNYNGTIEFDAGCKLDSWVDTGINPSYPKTQKEIVDALYALRENETFHGIYSLSGRVIEADAYSLMYGNQTITIDVEGRQVIVHRMTTGGVAIAEGDHVTVRGNLEDYQGKKQMTSAYLTHYDETTLAEAMDETVAQGEGGMLSYNEVVTGTISNVSYSSQFNNITFDLTDAYGTTVLCYRVKGYGMENWVDGDIVTVSGKLVNFKGTAQYDSSARVVCQRIIPETLESQIEAASFLSNGVYLHVPSTIIGKVSFIDSPYSAQYGNISFYVTNEEGIELYCYRVKGDGMDKLALGDTVKVEGYLTAYKGTAQFDSTATVTILEKGDGTYDDGKEEVTYKNFAEMVEAASKLKNNETLGVTTTQTGVIIDTPEYYAKNDNWQFTMDVDGVEIYCYGVLKGEKDVKKGGIATITGDLTAYSGKAQFSYATVIEDSYTAPAGGETPDEPETPEEPEKPTYNSFKEMVEAAAKLANKETLGVDITVEGEIIDEPKYAADYKNWEFTLDVDGVEIYCYGLLKNVENVQKGGTVKVTGDLTAHNGTPQFAHYTVTEAIYTAPAGGETPDEPETPDTPVVPETPEVVNVANGTYLIVAGNQAMTTLGKTESFGYPTGTQITWENGSATGYVQNNIFTITNTSNGKFTIKDTSGVLFCGPDGTHVSFNFNASAATEWIAYKTETDGVYTLKNVATEGTVAYSTSKSSFGVYTNVYDDGIATIALIAVPATAPSTPGTGEGEGSETPDTPDSPVVPEGPTVATIANGTYLIVAGNQAAEKMGATKDSSYLYTETITYENGGVSGYSMDNIFTITNSADGKFTITDGNGRKMGASSSDNKFAADATSANEWIAYEASTGVYTLKNVALDKTVGLYVDTSSSSFGVYSDPGSNSTEVSLIPVTVTSQPDASEVDTLAKQIEATKNLTPGSYLTVVKSTIKGVATISDAYSEKYGNITFSVKAEDGTELNCFRVKFDGAKTLKDGDTIEVTGNLYNYYGTVQFYGDVTATITPAVTEPDEPGEGGEGEGGEGEGGTESEPTTVTVSIASLGWANESQHLSLEMDSAITVSLSSGTNNGKFYTKGNEWRTYQGDNGKITISANGKTIVSVKITFNQKNGGALSLNGSTYSTKTVIPVNAASVTFGVTSTTGKTNGQVKITAIEVIYK